MWILLGAFLIGVVPLTLYALALWWLDRYEREPWPLMLAAFLWGFVPAALGSVLLGLILDIPLSRLLDTGSLAYLLTSSGLLAPLVEESMKGLGLLLVLGLFPGELDSPFDSFLYAAAIGFGFGAVENLLTLVAAGTLQELLALGVVRSLIFGLNHALYTGAFGLALGHARRRRNPWGRAALAATGFVGALALHAIHNAGIGLAQVSAIGLGMSAGSDLIGVIALALVAGYGLRRQAGVLLSYLEGEVARGTLTEAERRLAGSLRRRSAQRWRRLLAGDVKGWSRLGRFYQACGELAFALRAQAESGKAGPDRLQALRQRVAMSRHG